MRSLRVSLLVFLTTGLLCCGSERTSAGHPAVLTPIPQPELENLESLVQEQLREARHELDLLLARAPSPSATVERALGEMGQQSFAHGLMAAAAACFRNAQTLRPTSFRWPCYLGALAQREGRLDEASGYLEQAIRRNTDDVPSMLRLGQVALEQNSLATARRLFEQALEVDSQNAAAFYGLGRIATAEHAFREAVDQYQRALAAQPEATAIYHPLGLAYRQSGDLEKAETHLARAGVSPVRFADPLMDELDRFVSGSRVHLLAAYQAIQQGDWERAVVAHRKAVDSDPRDATLHLALGVLLGELKRDADAIESFRKAIDLDPGYPEAHFNLAAVLTRAGHLEEALHHFDQILAFDSQDLEARFHKAMVLNALEHVPRAIAELETILAVDPGYQEAHFNLATILARAGHLEEALHHVDQVLALDSGDLEARLYKAMVLTALEQLPQAVEQLETILAVDPTHSEARAQLDALRILLR